MSATSPSPASATTPQPPSSSSNSSAPQSSPSTTSSPPQPSSPPPDTSTSPPPSSLNADPPAPSTSSKPLTPSSQATPMAPPPPSPPPPATKSPPSSRPPQASPATSPLHSEAVSPALPPPPSNAPRPFSPAPPPPPPPVLPPESSPPPPSNQPAPSPPKSLANNSSPPPAPSSLQNSPPPTPAAEPPSRNPPPPPFSAAPPSRNSSPPTPSAAPPPKYPPSTPSTAPPQRNSSPPTPAAAPPPKHSPPPPSAAPPQRNSSPPPASVPSPKNSPPPPAAVPPQSSFPPPASTPSRNSPPPPQSTPPSSPPPPHPRKVVSPPASQPAPSPSNSTSKSSPSPAVWFTRPPSSPSLSPPSSPSLSPPSNSQNPSTTPSENEAESSNSSGNTNGGIGTGGIVAISLVAGILVLALFGIAIWCVRRQKKRPPLQGGHVLPSGPDSSSASDSSFFKTPSSAPPVQSGSGSDSMYTPSEPGGLGNSRSWFTYEELVKATNGFSAQNLLGEGGFGSVYKGCLPDGRDIAVKQLKIGGGQGEREFRAEVETISRIHHRHLVSMVGYCIQDSRRLLVYDYAPNNTLYFHLHGEGRPALDWAKRVRIAAGAARGLAYLHEDCNPRIIHRDIKSSNILLDYNFEARVSDFGLARLALDANTHVTTRVMGTFGYLAPEYASSGKLTEKSDVFSFGVVLLELITGRKPVDMSQPMGEESLVEWARPLLSQALENEEFEFDRLTDPRLEKNYVEIEMFRMFEVAAACVRHSATKRPNMGQVVRAFDSLATSDLTNGMRPGQSEVFDSALQSEEIKLFRRMAFGFQDYSTDFFSPPNSNM